MGGGVGQAASASLLPGQLQTDSVGDREVSAVPVTGHCEFTGTKRSLGDNAEPRPGSLLTRVCREPPLLCGAPL